MKTVQVALSSVPPLTIKVEDANRKAKAVNQKPIIKSKARVRSFGEVFTPPHIVAEMIDLVDERCQHSDTTFLEPAAGDGNFLTAVLRRKLGHLTNRAPKNLWAREALFILASIYGIELLEDNYFDAKYNMYQEFLKFLKTAEIPSVPDSDLLRSARFLIDRNIVQGNTLTAITFDDEPVTFSWWHRQVCVESGAVSVKREPFTFESIGDNAGFDFTTYEVFAPCPIDQIFKLPATDGRVGAAPSSSNRSLAEIVQRRLNVTQLEMAA
jgi:hypothetical protein